MAEWSSQQIVDLLKKGVTSQAPGLGPMAEVVGGKGGGKPDMAQAGGPNKDKLDEALKRVDSLL